MTPSQRGYYIQLLCHAWLAKNPGYLPNEPELLWKLAGAKSRAVFDRESELVLAQFRRRGKHLFHPWLVEERRAQLRRFAQRSTAGAKGATSRWESSSSIGSQYSNSMQENGPRKPNQEKKMHSTATVSPMANDSSSSSSSSATVNLREELGPQTPRSSPPLVDIVEKGQTQRRRYAIVGRLAEAAEELWKRNASATYDPASWKEDLKKFAAIEGLVYADNWPGVDSPIEKALSIATERIKARLV